MHGVENKSREGNDERENESEHAIARDDTTADDRRCCRCIWQSGGWPHLGKNPATGNEGNAQHRGQREAQFAAFSGMPAEIDPKEGGAFSMFGGMIVGRNVELIPNQRVVQAWRPTHWDPGVYSIVRFELKPRDPETMLVLDHTGFPEGEFDHLEWGWNNHYGETLKKFLV